MKTILITLALATAVFSADPGLPTELTTPKGKTYSGIKVTKIDPDGIRIVHDGGTAKVLMEELPADLRALFNFDPAAAEVFRAQTKEARAEAKRKAETTKKLVAQPVEVMPAGAGTIPEPSPQPRLYDIEDLKGIKADLAGKVVRVALFSGDMAPEQNMDRSYDILVGGNSNRDNRAHVVFPPGTGPVVRSFRELKGQTLKFYVLISPDETPWIKVVGLAFDPQKRIYTW